MLSMFVIGIKILLTPRGKLAPVWPSAAKSWAVVTVRDFVIVGEPLSDSVLRWLLLVGYAMLGLISAPRPALTLARGCHV